MLKHDTAKTVTDIYNQICLCILQELQTVITVE